MIVYIDEKVVIWRRSTYEVETEDEQEAKQILEEEYKYLSYEDGDNFKFIESEILFETEESYPYDGLIKEMLTRSDKILKQTNIK